MTYALYKERDSNMLGYNYAQLEEDLEIDKEKFKTFKTTLEKTLRKIGEEDYNMVINLFDAVLLEESELDVLDYRFKHKLSWNEIEENMGLCKRQCQRIKDKALNHLIIYAIHHRNEIDLNYYFLKNQWRFIKDEFKL